MIKIVMFKSSPKVMLFSYVKVHPIKRHVERLGQYEKSA